LLLFSAASVGVSGEKHEVRMLVWLLLLEVLGTDRKSWRLVAEQRSSQYHKLINKLLGESSQMTPERSKEPHVCQSCSSRLLDEDFEDLQTAERQQGGDNSFRVENRKKDPQCATRKCDYFVDARLSIDVQNLELINRDMLRTLSEFHFFSGEVVQRKHNGIKFTEIADHPSIYPNLISQHQRSDSCEKVERVQVCEQ
jgi:hypothetical protein